MTKNEQIKNKIRETRNRHNNMVCCVFEVKVIKGKLSNTKKSLLNQYFLEAKWLRNSELASLKYAAFLPKSLKGRKLAGLNLNPTAIPFL